MEEMGEASMRQLSKTGGAHPPFMLAWLAELDEAARKRTEALQAKQTQLAENTLMAAWIAAGAAIVAIWYFDLAISIALVAPSALVSR